MDMKHWKLARPADVPAGKPMIILQSVVLRCPPLSQDGQVHGLVLSGESVGKVVRLANDHALFYSGDIEIEADALAVLASRVTANADRRGALIVGQAGPYILGQLVGNHDSYMYGLSAGGELLFEDDIAGVRHSIVNEWRLVLLDGADRRVSLVEVRGIEAV